MVAKIYYIP